MLALLLFAVLIPVVFSSVAAQGDEFKLRLSRDFGYSSGTGKIQGTFSMRVSGPDNLVRVVYFIDKEPIGEATQEPFRLRFQTDDYEMGLHSMSAVGYTSDGRELHSNDIKAQFVSAEEGWQAGVEIMVPIFVIVFGILVLSFVMMFVSGRKLKNLPPGTPRNYGMAGGAICPRCARPYVRHFLAPNMLVGKLMRCPFCGKWAILPARPIDELRAAEAEELADAKDRGEGSSMSEDEKLRKDLDESRFQDY
jgi:hypothetical protein